MTKSRDIADSINRIDSSAADATAMTIDANENVGIGTSSPTSLGTGITTLDLKGNSSSQTDRSGGIRFTRQDGTHGMSIYNADGASYIESRSTYPLLITTNNSEAMRINSSGNVGIGETSPSSYYSKDLVVKCGSSEGGITIRSNATTDTNYLMFADGTSGTARYRGYLGFTHNSPENMQVVTYGYIRFYTGDPTAERMRIDTSGNLLVGTTGLPSSTNKGTALRPVSLDRTIIQMSSASTSTGVELIQFRNPNGQVGYIATNASSTTYATSSDYRLKENVADITDGITRLKLLNPSRFNFIANADTTVDGFLAHEVSDVVPEAITGEKDAMMDEEYEVTPAVLDDDGNVVTEAVMGTRSVPDYQGIDQSKLVPLLTAALQEAITKIETLETQRADLETRLTTLENAD